MTQRPGPICWNPRVNRAAWAVLMGIVPNGLDPQYTDGWIRTVDRATPGFDLEAVGAYTGLGADARGVGWHFVDGTVWLFVPGYQYTGQVTGWTGPPEVVLRGEADMDLAIRLLEAVARQLGIEP